MEMKKAWYDFHCGYCKHFCRNRVGFESWGICSLSDSTCTCFDEACAHFELKEQKDGDGNGQASE